MTEQAAISATTATPSTNNGTAAAPPAPAGGTAAAPAPQGTPTAPAANGAAAPVEKDKDNFGQRFAHLTKKEREITKRESAIKEQHTAVENFNKAKENAKKDPIAYLAAVGLDYETLTNHILSDGKPSPDQVIDELRGSVKTLAEKIEADKQAAADAKLKEENAMIEKGLALYRKESDAYIDQNADKYELIVAQGQKAEVFSLIESWFFEFGEVLTPEQAADKIETALLEDAKKLLAVKKLAPALQPQATGDQPTAGAVRVSPTDVQVSQPSPTITNDTMPSGVGGTGKPLTREEQKKRAASLLRFTP